MLESALERKFRLAVRSTLGGTTHKIEPTEKGIPDRLVCLPGGELRLVELKTETGRLSPAQRLWHSRAAQLGVVVDVIYGTAGLADWVAARVAQQNDK